MTRSTEQLASQYLGPLRVSPGARPRPRHGEPHPVDHGHPEPAADRVARRPRNGRTQRERNRRRPRQQNQQPMPVAPRARPSSDEVRILDDRGSESGIADVVSEDHGPMDHDPITGTQVASNALQWSTHEPIHRADKGHPEEGCPERRGHGSAHEGAPLHEVLDAERDSEEHSDREHPPKPPATPEPCGIHHRDHASQRPDPRSADVAHAIRKYSVQFTLT